MGGVTRQDPEIGELKARVSGVEAKMVAMGTEVRVQGEQIRGYIESGQAHRERMAAEQSEVKAGLTETKTAILRMQELAEAREKREAEAAEREAEHRRAMEREALAAQQRAANGRADAVKAVLGHPAVVSILGALAGAITLWGYSVSGQSPPTGQAAATGVMSAGVGD